MNAKFLGIECPFEKADYVVIPIAYEATTSCFVGTYYAPLRILESSHQLEDYIPELELNAGDLEIHTIPIFHPSSLVPEEAVDHISERVKEVINWKKNPVIIGGEHTITLGALKAFGEETKVIFVDAHLDFHNQFHNEKICHATVGKRIAEKYRMAQIGGRAYEIVEAEELSKGDVIFLPLKSFFDSNEKIVDEFFRSPVYLSVDLDILSPDEGISVGNPVPNGWSVNELLYLINFFILNCDVIGIDFCEYTPTTKTGDILISKIIQQTIAFMEIKKCKK